MAPGKPVIPLIKLPFRKTKNGITLDVKVEPRSSKKGISGIMDGHIVKVKLTAPPVEGSANEQLIEVLAEELCIKKSQVRVVRGHTSKRKIVEITGVEPD
ncbi:MAG: YggU family protein [Nitrospirae bacterium]|nr:YggU family protein [Nitrospirota bacterium]